MSIDIFECQEDVHAIVPPDSLDPSGTECKCRAIVLLGVVSTVFKDGHKTFLGYLIETTPDESQQPDPQP